MLKTITINTETHKVVPVEPTHEMVSIAQFHTEHSVLDEDDENHHIAKGMALAVYSEMLAAAPEFNESPWLHIESAPKDGTPILLREKHFAVPFAGYWIDGKWCASHAYVEVEDGLAIIVDNIFQEMVSHWMPNPITPEGV